MPALFAVGAKVIKNPQVATFAAFGTFAMLLLADFSGPMRARLQAQASLALAGALLVTLGTLASRYTWLAALSMALVGFAVVFIGVISSVLAGATTSLLLAFILPVSLPAPVSAVPSRLEGWGLASIVALAAVAVLWPAPTRDPLRPPAILACRALARRLRDDAGTAADDAVAKLRSVFFATPYRPTGLSTSARALVRLVDELGWLNAIADHAETEAGLPLEAGEVAAVRQAGAAVLERGADLLESAGGTTVPLRSAVSQLGEALANLERHATIAIPALSVAPSDQAATVDDHAMALVSSLDPSFRAQELSFAVIQVATNIDFAIAAEHRTWVARLLGRQPEGLAGPISAAHERASSYLERHSVWLHNSVRAGVGLGLGVLVADLTAVQHSFWVVLGVLSVLRSNALNTGQTILRVLGGTVAGFIIGAALLTAIGTNTTVLWALLPVAVLFAGFAPAAISFAAGQAGFTVTLLVLFNIAQPQGWQVGLVRVEDIALGCAISLAVGLLFWPRGAAAALGQALAEGYSEGARYLSSAVNFGLGCCDPTAPEAPVPADEASRAAAAARRLDDAFRSYLAERGAKTVPLAEVTTLVTGVAGLRLSGDAVVDLWRSDEGKAAGERAVARRELHANAELVAGWYECFAGSLSGDGGVPGPQASDLGADDRLVDAVRHDLVGEDGHSSAVAVRMIWTGDHLDAARRLEQTLVGPAREAKAQRALAPLGGLLPVRSP